MGSLKDVLKRLSHTQALDQASGPKEILFFESIYRLTYVIGLSSVEQKTSYNLYKFLVQLAVILLTIAELVFVFTDGSNLDDAAKCLGVFLLQCISQYRYRNVVSNKPVYEKLARSMNTPNFDAKTAKRQKIVKTWAQKGESYLKRLIILGNSSLWFWFLDPLLDDLEYNLAVDLYLPFYYKTPLVYPVVYTVVFIVLWYAAYFVLVTCLTMQAHLVHLLCQFEVLGDGFENLIEDCVVGFKDVPKDDLAHNTKFVEKYKMRLSNLVDQHKLILSNTKELGTVLSRPMLAQLGASGLMICFVGYELATTFNQSIVTSLVSFLFLAYNIFELYVIFSWCEQITGWSHKIGESLYSSGWEYGLTNIPGVRSSILIVLARANDPIYLTAGGMYNLSIESFARLMKGSYSALTVLLGTRPD